MQFSILLEGQLADPTPERERRLFHACVEQAELADALGYHRVWVVEHHGLYEYSHSSAPETLLAFIAARTRRIRLGHGVTLTPHRYNHPLRVAERVATLDVLSDGRVDWGSGKSASRVEQGAFQIERAELHDQWTEALEMIPRMWQSEVFEWHGRFFDVPPTRVLPKPVQAPHPPLFAACSAPESVMRAATLGLGALNFAHGTDEYLARKVRAYRKAASAVQPVGRAVNVHFACTPTALVLDDDREACVHGFRASRFFAAALAGYAQAPDRPTELPSLPKGDLDEADLRAAMAARSDPKAQLLAVVGDPRAAQEAVRRFAAAGVDELILVMQLGTLPHEMVLRSLRTFAEKVMAHVA